MPPLFYQEYWHLVGGFVTKEILKVLNSGSFLVRFNYTFITLVPKKEHVMKGVYFRPICLCNVLYKIMAKVVANRLKLILPNIISETQSAFVPYRQISDNILIVFDEILHSLRWKTKLHVH